MTKPKICLVMIVKNEEHVISRCLEALKPHIDAWCIMDTGSEDKTMELIHKILGNIPGKLLEEPFDSFRYNRSKVMQIAREEFDADYLLMMDADDTFIAEKDFKWPDNLNHGCYYIKHFLHSTSFSRPALTKASLPWRYEGAAHEYQTCDEKFTRGHELENVKVVCGTDGHRRKTEGQAKYDRIAKILQKEYEKDKTNPRTVFYLAQSYRDAGHFEMAIKFYRIRSGMGGYDEEVWYSMYQIAVLTETLGVGFEITREAYLQAYLTRPSRAEPLWRLARLHRLNRQNHMATIYALAGVSTKRPNDRLFVDEWSYTWRCQDELCVNSQKIGLMEQAKDAALKVLARPEVMYRNRTRTEDNLTWSSRIITGRKPEAEDEIMVVLSTHNGDKAQIRESVESIIAQTYEIWRLLIISDGDETPPWDALKGIEDPRISMIHLPENNGQFPIYDAVLRFTKSPLFAIQDDDDISKPTRLGLLADKMRRMNADVVFSDIESENKDGEYCIQPCHPEWLAERPNDIIHVGSHVGLWKTESLRRLGGYYGGFDLGADTMVVGLMAQLGRASYLHEALYRARRTSDNSMTRKKETHIHNREHVWADIRSLWKKVQQSSNPVATARQLMHERAREKKDIGLIAELIRNQCKF